MNMAVTAAWAAPASQWMVLINAVKLMTFALHTPVGVQVWIIT